jgi:molybdenum cofactor biosynthesis enzyme MoaA
VDLSCSSNCWTRRLKPSILEKVGRRSGIEKIACNTLNRLRVTFESRIRNCVSDEQCLRRTLIDQQITLLACQIAVRARDKSPSTTQRRSTSMLMSRCGYGSIKTLIVMLETVTLSRYVRLYLHDVREARPTQSDQTNKSMESCNPRLSSPQTICL